MLANYHTHTYRCNHARGEDREYIEHAIAHDDVVHEAVVGFQKRFTQQRDDRQKTHPCLVPYEALPDEEKDYDRHTAIGTLKLIMKLGFQITNGTEGPASVRQE